jgi:hypothetical protein
MLKYFKPSSRPINQANKITTHKAIRINPKTDKLNIFHQYFFTKLVELLTAEKPVLFSKKKKQYTKL